MAFEFAPNKTDAGLNPAAIALPAAAGTVNSASMDLNAVSPFIPKNTEFQLAVPVLTVGEFPNASTATYTFQDSADDATFLPVMVLTEATQTGAAGAGAAAITIRFNAPSDVRRYIRVSVLTAAGALDCSAKTMALTIRCAP